MLKSLTKIGPLASLLCLASIAGAQAVPVTTSPASQVGFGITYARPDFWVQPIGDPQYSRQFILGVSGYGDYDFSARIGLEADFHCIALITSLDRAELTYLVGPRFMYTYRNRYTFYVKGMVGFRDLFIQEWQDNIGIPGGMGSAYAVGTGLDYQYNPKWNIRVFDIEVQKWPTYSTNGINPVVITAGAAYRFR